MAPVKQNLLEIEIEKLFEELKIEDIVAIEQSLDKEIEKKREELRSTVSDRYKDILSASDSIKCMKDITEKIVGSINNISEAYEELVSSTNSNLSIVPTKTKSSIEPRLLAIQLRLAMQVNEDIWMYLDKEDNLNAVQVYLLGQNIHTGLQIFNSNHLKQVPLVKLIGEDLFALKDVIFRNIRTKLESIALSAEETCSNLNGLLLLQNQNSSELINTFMQHRKTALNSVIEIEHTAVRLQISAMVKCLKTTIHLLYDCFMCSTEYEKGLIWKQLSEITSDNSAPTISKMHLPKTPLNVHIPEITKHFKPQCNITLDFQIDSKDLLIEEWLEDTKNIIEIGLKNCLELVSSLKGLHIIKEESLKLEPHPNWEDICKVVGLPDGFDIWYYFFQNYITERACILLKDKIKSNLISLQNEVENALNVLLKQECNELNLRSYIWSEDVEDIFDNYNQNHLAMKAQGFSSAVVKITEKLDKHFLNILLDSYPYLYGTEFNVNNIHLEVGQSVNNHSIKPKNLDYKFLQTKITEECLNFSLEFTKWIEHVLKNQKNSSYIVNKHLLCIRLLQALPRLCRYFKKCCSIEGKAEDWQRISDIFNKCSINLWQYWIKYFVKKTEENCQVKLGEINIRKTLNIFLQWDIIEIQEQAEEEQVVKSQIKVPLKPSIVLEEILYDINDNLCSVLPHTIPKTIHVEFIERNVEVILNHYKNMTGSDFNQNQALQFIFDVKYLTTFCVLRDNTRLIGMSQEICDKLRSRIDPFDLDVFYSYLQANIKRAVIQSQVILGSLLPSPMQTANIGLLEKSNQEKEPSILAISVPSTNTWFPLLPITAPSYKNTAFGQKETQQFITSKPNKPAPTKNQDSGNSIKSSATSLFGGLTTDWFS